jgi:transposase
MASKFHLEPDMFRAYRQGEHQKDIAAKFDVSEQMVCRYKKKFDWDRRARDWNNSNHASVEKLLAMRDDAIDKQDADAIWKIQKTIQAIDGEFDRLAYTIEIMDDFLAYCKATFPRQFKRFQSILPEFLNDQRNRYKK